jgi:predicted SAM-dependent methyltransferase
MKTPLKYHLGCGDIRLDGWVNVDARVSPAVDLVCDLADVSKLTGGAAAVYACHVLEHFGFNGITPSAGDALKGWVGLLAPLGACFISVPDLQKVGAAIAATDNPAAQFNFMKCIYGGCEYPQNRHFVGFTENLLCMLMEQCGLINVGRFPSFAEDTSRFNLHGCDVSLNLVGYRAP